MEFGNAYFVRAKWWRDAFPMGKRKGTIIALPGTYLRNF